MSEERFYTIFGNISFLTKIMVLFLYMAYLEQFIQLYVDINRNEVDNNFVFYYYVSNKFWTLTIERKQECHKEFW